MIRLTHLSGSLQGTASTSPKAVVRIGRGADCDVRFDARLDARVSTHHAEIRFDGGYYQLIDIGSSNGTLVNGKLVRQQKLRSGDKIIFGAQGGPEVKFEIDDSAFANAPPPGRRPPPQQGYVAQGYAPQAMPQVSSGENENFAEEAQQRIAQARVGSQGAPSGQTMFIMADTLKKVEAVTQKKSGKKWKKIVLGVVLTAFVGFGAMGFVIWEQKQQIDGIVHKKDNLDKQIQKIQLQMQLESDPDKLANLEEQLNLLTGKAKAAIGELEQKDKSTAEKVVDQGDDLDRAIRRILKKFDADTYAVPPIFKERLQHYIDLKTSHLAITRQVYARKKQYWPIIVKEFSALGLPEEIAYVAWQESNFDPFAQSAVGARGMWQFMDFQARKYGLHVAENWKTGGKDERTDVAKETHIAAKYLSDLLADFGSDSFMIAIASYNKGENGMRRVLHDVGFRKDQRDFWHLYRLKRLPEETMEYVPQILAAAIISNDPQKYGLE
ncbi:MAG TPA: transglycosylase SLT domain-containing protein [Myxococcales bacterium]|jgi:soluble lytic murein transglycosylase-like protein|nr:transglycosylase SLT domain-containing protein [Myxococcales bacterium]